MTPHSPFSERLFPVDYRLPRKMSKIETKTLLGIQCNTRYGNDPLSTLIPFLPPLPNIYASNLIDRRPANDAEAGHLVDTVQ